MTITVCRYIFASLLIMMAVIITPFLPGRYDPLAKILSSFLQLYSGLGLITLIPASLWFLRNIKYPTNKVPDDSLILKRHILFRIYFWLNSSVLLVTVLIIGYSRSLTLGIAALIALVYFSRKAWYKLIDPKSHKLLFSKCLPVSLALLPLLLFVFQLAISKPITNLSRNRAIKNCSELIDEIEKYKEKYDRYPLTLNAVHGDYSPGVAGIDQYHYTYDSSTYNIYFEQPRFFFDKVGTLEFVAYNPRDTHLMMSHASWHMLLEPHLVRNTQGWYETVETNFPHWKRFMFD